MLPQDMVLGTLKMRAVHLFPVRRLFRESGRGCAHAFSVDMGSHSDRFNGTGEHEASSSSSPASFRDEMVPAFRGLLRRAAGDLRAEASAKSHSEQKDRLLRLAAMLDRYAEDSA